MGYEWIDWWSITRATIKIYLWGIPSTILSRWIWISSEKVRCSAIKERERLQQVKFSHSSLVTLVIERQRLNPLLFNMVLKISVIMGRDWPSSSLDDNMCMRDPGRHQPITQRTVIDKLWGYEWRVFCYKAIGNKTNLRSWVVSSSAYLFRRKSWV